MPITVTTTSSFFNDQSESIVCCCCFVGVGEKGGEGERPMQFNGHFLIISPTVPSVLAFASIHKYLAAADTKQLLTGIWRSDEILIGCPGYSIGCQKA